MSHFSQKHSLTCRAHTSHLWEAPAVHQESDGELSAHQGAWHDQVQQL